MALTFVQFLRLYIYIRYKKLKVMKKLLVILFSVGLTLGASAQKGHFSHGGGYFYRPSVTVGFGYPYYGYGFYGAYGPYGVWGPWGPYPGYYYGQGAMPTRLAVQINDIKSDYKAQIKATRQDKSIPHKERRERIRQLKHDRDQAVVNARHDYYTNSRRNYNNNNNSNNNNNRQEPQQQPQQ
jgi:hypothetical protein